MISTLFIRRARLVPGALLALSLCACNVPSALHALWNPFERTPPETVGTEDPAQGPTSKSRLGEQPSRQNDETASVLPATPIPPPPPRVDGMDTNEPVVPRQDVPRRGPQELWARLRQGMRLGDALPPSLSHARRWLRTNGGDVEKVLARGQTHLPYIVEAVEARALPAEIALIPAIESGFRPNARSPLGADGLWQFMPATATDYGLKRTWWYEGRRDIVAATGAALDYLEALNRRFHGNWLLTMAAYNCGEGTAERILKRAGVTAREADLWALLARFPKETRHYVPKLLALSELVRSPERFGVRLPALRLEPQFDVVDIKAQLELAKAAQLAGVSPQAIYDLNPGFRRWATDPGGPHRLLTPRGTGAKLTLALASLPPSGRVTWQRHTIRPGENLSLIAHRFGLRVRDLMVANNLSSSLIRAGNALLVPTPRAHTVVISGPVKRRTAREVSKGTIYRVRAGDSLWRIARRHNTSVAALMRLNGLTRASVLRPGQVLRLA